MEKIYCIIGKSSSGKDTIYKRLCEDKDLNLKKNVNYTTRPIREGERNDVDYHYVDDNFFEIAKLENRVVESRTYQTAFGPWTYFTLSDEFDLDEKNYILVNTLQGFKALKDYYGEETVIPIYIYIEDIIRLERALNREKKEKIPKCKELCRRFLADEEDFSDENLLKANIPLENYFYNDDLEECIDKVKQKILEYQKIYRKK